MPSARGLSGSRWPVHPHRLDDELFSSWLARTAYANGLKVHSFTTMALGKSVQMWTRDPDRSTRPETIAQLSVQTGSSPGELASGLLSSYDGMFVAHHNPNGNTKWMLPLGIYHRTRRCYGVQFCPTCLWEDRTPYFRRRWRLAFATMCDIHTSMLHDRCPKCEAPVIYFRNDLGRRSGYRLGDLVSCWQCDFDLRHARAVSAPGPDGLSLVALRSLITFPDLGWWWQGNISIQYAHLYFDVLHHLVSFLATGKGIPLQQAVRRQTGWPTDIFEGQRKQFERRPVHERHRLLVMALWLLDDWPQRFINAARGVGLRPSYILRDAVDLPHWFTSEVRLLAGHQGHVSEEEAKSAAALVSREGNKVTGAAVQRMLGNRGGKRADSYATHRRSMTDDEYQRAVELFDQEIAGLPKRSANRLRLQRDKVMFRLAKLTGWSTPRIVGLTIKDAVQIATAARNERLLPSSVGGMLMTYLRDTRRYMVGEETGNALFIGYRRDALSDSALYERLTRMTRRYGVRFTAVL